MKVAVIGTGIAGLTAASTLARRHALTVFEASTRVGGHTRTEIVHEGERAIPVDTGFIVFNEPNYPNLCRLFDALGVQSRASDMSFSVHCEQSGIEYNGTSLESLFAQRRNALRPSHWRMLADIARLHREAPGLLGGGLDDSITVGRFVAEHHYGRAFTDRYLVPLGASLWSCDAAGFLDFPVRFVLEFLHNHAMLQVDDRPVWRTVVGGSHQYIRPLVRPFADRIRTRTPVTRIEREGGQVALWHSGTREVFDEVVLACHADQALAMVADADEVEREVLATFPYQVNEAVLHTDTGLLPDRRRAWASWNYRIPAADRGAVTVTYDMNRLQGLDTEERYCVSLNPGGSVDPARVLRRIRYEHPLFTTGRANAQARQGEMVRRRGISYCGAYWGYGFHEDGVRSALSVADGFDLELAA